MTEDFQMEHSGKLMTPGDGSSSDTKSSTAKSQRFIEELKWDVNIIDQLLHVCTPIILLAIGISLLCFINPPLDNPEPKITCWCPSEFTGTMVVYAQEVCSNGVGELRNVSFDDPQDQQNSTMVNLSDFKMTSNPFVMPTYELFQFYFSMAVYSVVPFLLWRVFGRLDGAGIVRLTKRGSSPGGLCSPGTLTLLWFVACKILSVILLTVIYLDAADIPDKFRRQENFYFDHMKDMEQSPAETVMCSFNIFILGSPRGYSVPCSITPPKTDGGERYMFMLYTFSRLTRVVSIWLLIVLLANAINAVTVAVTFLLSFVEKWRNSMVSRFIGSGSGLTANQQTAFVCVMSARNGQTLQVQHLLQEAQHKVR